MNLSSQMRRIFWKVEKKKFQLGVSTWPASVRWFINCMLFVKPALQMLQMCAFCPSWHSICFFKMTGWVKPRSQRSHLYGRMSLWTLKWLRNDNRAWLRWNGTLTSYEVWICLFWRTLCYKLNRWTPSPHRVCPGVASIVSWRGTLPKENVMYSSNWYLTLRLMPTFVTPVAFEGTLAGVTTRMGNQ